MIEFRTSSDRNHETAGPRIDDVNRLIVRSVSKRFPGVLALDGVSIEVAGGEVLAVIGENGAGKSTLMKIIAGNERPDAGEMEFRGTRIDFATPRDAIDSGISLIHQELNLAANLTVADNVLLGREPNRWGWIDRRELWRRAGFYLDRVGLNIPPSMPLASLSIAERQLVEIAKALSTQARVIIMDEPTSSLSQGESQRLFRVIDQLRHDRVAIVYISHRLAEVRRVADRVEVLRDGRNVGSLVGARIERDRMVTMMVGREIRCQTRASSAARVSPDQASLRIEGLRPIELPGGPDSAPIDLHVGRGEVVGIAGLVGAGRSELLETIFGVRRARGGKILIDGRPLSLGRADRSVDAGLALVSEDRKETGLLLDSSVSKNITMSAIGRAPWAPLTNGQWEHSEVARQIDQLHIKVASQRVQVGALSGGNQQKIAIAKWLLCRPKVLLLDEPTRGVDIGAREEIYEILRQLAADGMSILFASSDMEEVIAMSDRVLVMHGGKIVGELEGEAIEEEAIMDLAVGPVPAEG